MAPEKLLAEWFWIDRWMGSSGFALPIAHRGLYREMLTQAWRRKAQLPNDHDQIRRMTGVTMKEWNHSWPVVAKYWRITGDQLVNDTQLEIYAKAMAASERASQRGLSGAQARLKQRSSSAQAQPEQRLCSAQAATVVVLEHKPPVSGLRSPEKQEQIPRVSVQVPMSEKPDDETGTRAGKFIERYAELYPLHRGGARFLPKPALDYQAACELVKVWDDVRLEKLAIIFLKTDHEFAVSGSRTIRQFAALASWCDGRLADVESGRRA